MLVPVHVPVFQSNLLQGRKALVTGGTSGIGNGIALSFLRAGAKVVITGRNQDRVARAVESLRVQMPATRKSEVEGVVLDNSLVEDFAEKVDMIWKRFGGVDILVNNAGLVKGAKFGLLKVNEYDEILATNLRGVVFLSQCIANRWKSEGVKGNILNICSASSVRPGNSAYILSKWGLRSFTLGMAKELIPYGVVVNGLAPGPTATPHFLKNGECGLNWPRNPSGRMATVDEIANLAVVLVSDMGRMVVGDVLYASGGAGVITVDDV